MREKGMLVTCDRCEKTIFRKLVSKFNISGEIEKYEDLPKDWVVVNGKDLCPKCAMEREIMLDLAGF